MACAAPAPSSVRGEIDPSGEQAIPARKYAYRCLKTVILSGRFALGQRLTEEPLAGEFGISRTPIREALGALLLMKKEGRLGELTALFGQIQETGLYIGPEILTALLHLAGVDR